MVAVYTLAVLLLVVWLDRLSLPELRRRARCRYCQLQDRLPLPVDLLAGGLAVIASMMVKRPGVKHAMRSLAIGIMAPRLRHYAETLFHEEPRP